jgi:hypothetical protein
MSAASIRRIRLGGTVAFGEASVMRSLFEKWGGGKRAAKRPPLECGGAEIPALKGKGEEGASGAPLDIGQ